MTEQWAFDKLAVQMGQSPEPISNKRYGDGRSFTTPHLAEDDYTETSHLNLYEAREVAEITTPNMEIRLKDLKPPRPAKDGVLMETQDGTTQALFLKDGHIAVEVFPASQPVPLESSTTGQEAPSSSEGAGMPEEWRTPSYSTAQDTAEMSSGQGSVASVAVESHERQPRIKVTGFVATEPNMKPTPAGKPRVQFLVAEHPETPEGEDPQTIYHRVYTLNKTAERLQGKGIEKGKKVAVDGYVQERKRKGKNGKEETYPVIYANNVRVLYVHKLVDY